MFSTIKKFIDNSSYQKKKDALVLASELAKIINVKIDRAATRSKDGLVCWFCENWTQIQPYLYLVDHFNSVCNEISKYPGISSQIEVSQPNEIP